MAYHCYSRVFIQEFLNNVKQK